MGVVKDLLLICLFLTMVIYYIKLYNEIKRQQRYFIDTLSHDLKVATLAQIRGLDLLQHKLCMNKEESELLDDIHNSCKFTLDMITMLLSTYQYEYGTPSLEQECVNLSELINSTCQNLLLSAGDKNITFLNNDTKDNYIWGNKNSLLKMLANLVSTAISNADKNSTIHINISAVNQWVEVSITYQGKSLTNEECRKMFLKKTEYSTVGHGIKMYLCKKIIDFHKGKICVKNCADNKTSFTFTLPLAKSDMITQKQLISAS